MLSFDKVLRIGERTVRVNGYGVFLEGDERVLEFVVIICTALCIH